MKAGGQMINEQLKEVREELRKHNIIGSMYLDNDKRYTFSYFSALGHEVIITANNENGLEYLDAEVKRYGNSVESFDSIGWPLEGFVNTLIYLYGIERKKDATEEYEDFTREVKSTLLEFAKLITGTLYRMMDKWKKKN